MVRNRQLGKAPEPINNESYQIYFYVPDFWRRATIVMPGQQFKEYKLATESMLKRPDSVIRFAPTSGVFGTSRFIHDEESFSAKVLYEWYKQPNNAIPVETPQHINYARQLYPLYCRYRSLVDSGAVKAIPAVLKCLVQKGCIRSAEDVLASHKG